MNLAEKICNRYNYPQEGQCLYDVEVKKSFHLHIPLLKSFRFVPELEWNIDITDTMGMSKMRADPEIYLWARLPMNDLTREENHNAREWAKKEDGCRIDVERGRLFIKCDARTNTDLDHESILDSIEDIAFSIETKMVDLVDHL